MCQSLLPRRTHGIAEVPVGPICLGSHPWPMNGKTGLKCNSAWLSSAGPVHRINNYACGLAARTDACVRSWHGIHVRMTVGNLPYNRMEDSLLFRVVVAKSRG